MPQRRSKPPRTLRGMRPSAGLRVWYRKKLIEMVDEMQASIMWWLRAKYKSAGVIAQDAMVRADDPMAGEPEPKPDSDAGSVSPPVDMLQEEMARLREQWQTYFDKTAEGLAETFARKAAGDVAVNTKEVLKDLGLTVKMQITPAMKQAYEGVIGEQIGLIRNLSQQHLAEIERAVMVSVQRGRDLEYLTNELQTRYGITRRRAEFIARDQNNKATSTLTVARDIDIGFTHGIWMHSHAGKKPRKSHVEAHGKEFELKKGMFLDGKWIFTGQEPNCRCWYKPVPPAYLTGKKQA